MAKRTQKAGLTARFGSRYGVSVRRRAGSALRKKSKEYTCPSCQYQKVRRKVKRGSGSVESAGTHSPEASGNPSQEHRMLIIG